jgi:TATA-box binding protein (TBP) (component of TFIID and TFIIIB)
MTSLEHEWKQFKKNVDLANVVPKTVSETATFHKLLATATEDVVEKCRKERKRQRDAEVEINTSDEAILQAVQYTDSLPLADFGKVLHLVPRLVNIVTLAEAIPVAGTGVKLPLDLHLIASKCSNSYYAPRRFAAVQLAFDSPRCRVLVFHTGRLVGTGCSGPMAARLSILRAARQLALEANIFIHIRNYNVINTVAAVSIDARLNCDAFASTHSATSHYDRQSFVGLAWRPPGESCCVEIYSTGRANLPGATRQRCTLTSFARMLGELLRHSDRTDVLELLDKDLRDAHRPSVVQRDDATAQDDARRTGKLPMLPPLRSTLWDTPQEELPDELSGEFLMNEDDEDLLMNAGF